MRTVCCICGCALVCADDLDDSNAMCSECWRANLSGQSIPEMDVPRVVMLEGLGRRRAAYERIARRYWEETGDAG